MASVFQLEALIEQARRAGFVVRYEYLGGNGGGVCEYSGKRWVFIDLALSSEESWELLREALVDAEPIDRPVDAGQDESGKQTDGTSVSRKRRTAA